MLISIIDGRGGDPIFVAESRFEEKDALRAAGFTFHGDAGRCRFYPRCSLCEAGMWKRWWTKRKEAAARLLSYCDERAKAALASHEEARAASRATDADVDLPCPPGLAYLPFQKAGIAYARSRDATLIADEMGLGKTIQAIGVANADPEVRSILVICPKTLCLNWRREALGDSYGKRGWLVDDGRAWKAHVVEADEPVPEDANLVIVSYNRVTVTKSSTACPTCKGEGDVPCSCPFGQGITCPRCNGEKYLPAEAYMPRTRCPDCDCRKCEIKTVTPKKGNPYSIGVVSCEPCKGEGRIPKTSPLNARIVTSLMARTWDLLIVDEAHRCKDQAAQRTKAILGDPPRKGRPDLVPGLIHRAKRKLFLTGSPILNKPIELWPLLHALDERTWGSFFAYAKRYCDAHEEFVGRGRFAKRVWNFDGSSNLEELQEKLRGSCMVRRLKADVLPELPPKRRTIVVLPRNGAASAVEAEEETWEKFSDEAAIAEAALEAAEEDKDEDSYTEAAKRLRYVEQAAFEEMSRVRHTVALAKLPACLEHIDGRLEDGAGKLIVFCHHNDIAEKIYDHYTEGDDEAHRDAAVLVYGKDGDPGRRQAAVDRFENDPKCRIFVGSIGAAGEGLTLVASSHVIFVEQDWTPARMQQAEDRAHRIGQIRQVEIENLVVDGSLDAHVAHLLLEKQEIAEKALDGGTRITLPVLPTRKGGAYPVATDEERRLTKEAMLFLAMRCDGALAEDGAGFSKIDARIGQKLGTFRGVYSDGQVFVGKRLARKYRRQLPGPLAAALGVFEETKAEKKRREKETREALGEKEPRT